MTLSVRSSSSLTAQAPWLVGVLSNDALLPLSYLQSFLGSRINQAKNALQLFLRSLPFGTKFNIVSFGTKHSSLFPESVPFDDERYVSASPW